MLKHFGSLVLLGTVVLLAYPLRSEAAAQQVIMIKLQDGSGAQSITGMAMTIDPSTVRAGRVTLQAVNESKELVHEVLVVPAPRSGTQLLYDTEHDRVVERRAHPLGEIADLKPSMTGKLTLTLKPGTYLLLCNQPGHYKAGMSTALIVDK